MGDEINLTWRPFHSEGNSRTLAPPFVSFGEVLSVAEAARCARASEADIARAVESGDLPAGEGALGPYVKRRDLVAFLAAGGMG